MVLPSIGMDNSSKLEESEQHEQHMRHLQEQQQQQHPQQLFTVLASHRQPPPMSEKPVIKPTLKRYIVLLIFCLNWANKAFQWIQIPAITKKVTYFYDVDNYVINATSVIFMLSFVFLSWPACYIIERIGIRRAVLASSVGAAFGALVKCFSCNPGGIYLLFLGQIMVSFSEQLIFSTPNRLASVWFPDHQVSSAMAMTVLGAQIGCALGFVIPQWLVNDAETPEQIGQGLWWMFLGNTLFSFAIFISGYWLFDEAPKHAPGIARLKQIDKEKETNALRRRDFVSEMRILLGQMRNLLRNWHFNLLVAAYGITVGVGYTVSTLLNQMLEPLWPGDDIFVGNIGFLIIVCGALSSPVWGQLLDRTHRYKLINILSILGNILSLALFGYMLVGPFRSTLSLIYLAAALFGFFQLGIVVAGLELAIELTYPATELLTTSVMNVSPQIFGGIQVFLGSYIVDNYGTTASNLFYLACLALGLALLLIIRETLNRQRAVIEKRQAVVSKSSSLDRKMDLEMSDAH